MPDVRWCHPCIRRASHIRREGKHVVELRPCAVAPGAAARQRPKPDPGRAAALSTCRNHTGRSRTLWRSNIRACACIYEENLSNSSHGRHRVPSHRLLLRSSTAAVIGHHPWCGGIGEGSEMGHQKNQDRAHSSAQHSRRTRASLSPPRAMQPLRATGPTVVPHHLTSACSGLATLAADARR